MDRPSLEDLNSLQPSAYVEALELPRKDQHGVARWSLVHKKANILVLFSCICSLLKPHANSDFSKEISIDDARSSRERLGLCLAGVRSCRMEQGWRRNQR